MDKLTLEQIEQAEREVFGNLLVIDNKGEIVEK